MTLSSRQRSLVWLALILLAAALLAWIQRAAVQHVKTVSAQFSERPAYDAESPTGYVDGKRHLIPLDHNAESFQWIAQAQLIAASGNWRLREVDYDNAPRTRPVYSPSPYRWWLVGWGKLHAGENLPLGAAIESGVLWADPVLHWLLFGAAVALVAWHFGLFAAAVVALLLAASFPVLSAFYPGSPNDRGLATVSVVGSILALLVGATGWRPRTSFVVAGVLGALGLWFDPNRLAPVLGGVGLGGLFAAWWLNRRPAAGEVDAARQSVVRLPWRWWAIAGAIATVLVWVVENAPDRLDPAALRLENVHPLYAVSWLGLGLLLARASRGWAEGKAGMGAIGWSEVCGGILALAAVPVTMVVTKQAGFLAGDALSAQMSPLPGSERAADFGDWLKVEGIRLSFWALMLPVLMAVGLGAWQTLRRTLAPDRTQAVLIALGPVLLGIVVAWDQLAWWMTTGALAVVLLGMLAAHQPVGLAQRRFAIAIGIALLPSVVRVLPLTTPQAIATLTPAEQRTVVERDLAYWLTKRIDDYRSVVLAPPECVPALYYYGSVRGLGSPYQGNEDGFGAAVRIAAATSPDEAEALATQRELSHIIMPNWDGFLTEYARLGAAQPEYTLVALLHNWLPPRWLRAVHHPLPQVSGFEADNGATIFEVVDVQDNATALSRLGEYFIETGQLRFAYGISTTLAESFPSDLGGLVARAQIAVAMNDRPAFEKIMAQILPYLEDARDGDLIWDRRVNLANLLMLAQQRDYAAEQVQFCMDEVDEYLLRTVTPPTLFRFMLLCQILGEPFPEDYLQEAALRQLSAKQRQELNP